MARVTRPGGTIYLHSLNASQQAAIRDACRAQLPDRPFTLPARAWYARGLVPKPLSTRPH